MKLGVNPPNYPRPSCCLHVTKSHTHREIKVSEHAKRHLSMLKYTTCLYAANCPSLCALLEFQHMPHNVHPSTTTTATTTTVQYLMDMSSFSSIDKMVLTIYDLLSKLVSDIVKWFYTDSPLHFCFIKSCVNTNNVTATETYGVTSASLQIRICCLWGSLGHCIECKWLSGFFISVAYFCFSFS